MAEIEIRPAISNDIAALESFDTSCETTHVWQIDSHLSKDHITFELKEARLPRILRLPYPPRMESLKDSWTRHSLFLVARCEEQLVGYLILDDRQDLAAALISDIVVNAAMRRQGIASALILAAQEWLKSKGVVRLMIEVPAKNHPMIELLRKLRFEFCGLADGYYPNHDMAFFYVHALK